MERGVKKKETNSPSCPVLQEVRIVLASACLECSEAHTWKAFKDGESGGAYARSRVSSRMNQALKEQATKDTPWPNQGGKKRDHKDTCSDSLAIKNWMSTSRYVVRIR